MLKYLIFNYFLVILKLDIRNLLGIIIYNLEIILILLSHAR